MNFQYAINGAKIYSIMLKQYQKSKVHHLRKWHSLVPNVQKRKNALNILRNLFANRLQDSFNKLKYKNNQYRDKLIRTLSVVIQNSLKRRAFERIKFMKIKNEKLLRALKLMAQKQKDALMKYFNIWKSMSQGPKTELIKGLMILQKTFVARQQNEQNHGLQKLHENSLDISHKQRIALLHLTYLLEKKKHTIIFAQAFRLIKEYEDESFFPTDSDSESEDNPWFQLAPRIIGLNSVCNKQTTFWRLVLSVQDEDNNILPDLDDITYQNQSMDQSQYQSIDQSQINPINPMGQLAQSQYSAPSVIKLKMMVHILTKIQMESVTNAFFMIERVNKAHSSFKDDSSLSLAEFDLKNRDMNKSDLFLVDYNSQIAHQKVKSCQKMVAAIMHRRLNGLLKQAFDKWQMSTSSRNNMISERINQNLD